MVYDLMQRYCAETITALSVLNMAPKEYHGCLTADEKGQKTNLFTVRLVICMSVRDKIRAQFCVRNLGANVLPRGDFHMATLIMVDDILT